MKPWAHFAPASPPDVRQGFALPVSAKRNGLGFALGRGLCPQVQGPEAPGRGQSPHPFYYASGRAKPCLTSGGEAEASDTQAR